MGEQGGEGGTGKKWKMTEVFKINFSQKGRGEGMRSWNGVHK